MLVTTKMNERLTGVCTEEEVALAAFQLGALKIQGLDGFNGAFFQNY